MDAKYSLHELSDSEKDRLLQRLGGSNFPDRIRFGTELRERLDDVRVLPQNAPATGDARLSQISSRRLSYAAVAVLAAIVTGGAYLHLSTPSAVAKFIVAVGDVSISGQSAVEGDTYRATSQLENGADGLASLWLADQSILRIAERSAASLDGRRQVHLKRGRIYADVVRTEGEDRFQVQTPEATVVVLGTAFEVESKGDSTTVSVNRGEVRVEWDGGSAILSENESIVVSKESYLPIRRSISGAPPDWIQPLLVKELNSPILKTMQKHFPSRVQDIYRLKSKKR